MLLRMVFNRDISWLLQALELYSLYIAYLFAVLFLYLLYLGF